MARVLKFRGSSDDIGIWEEFIDGKRKTAEEVYPGRGDCVLLRVFNEHAGILVGLQYISPGVWMVGVAPLDEGVPLPDWPFNISAENYTAVLEITVPADVKVAEVKDEDDDS